jgi:rhodanese-related sulfurtransferase
MAVLVMAAAAAIISGGCERPSVTASVSPQSAIKDISPVRANALIQNNQSNPKFVILDVRTPQEYADGHLSNAVNIDFESSNFKNAVNKLDKNKTYLVYCRTGIRSAAASQTMEELGFKDIYDMSGGIMDWQSQGFPVVK